MYLTQGLKRTIQLYPDWVATIFGERKRSWKEVGQRVAKLAGAFRGFGVQQGDRIAILANNSDLYLETLYAIAWSGCVFVTINTRLSNKEIAFRLNDAGATILLFDEGFTTEIDDLIGQLKTVREFVYMGKDETFSGVRNYEDLAQTAQAIEEALRGYDDLAGLFYTGGTTGRSKGVMLSHRNLVSSSFNSITSLGFREGMRWLHSSPLHFIAEVAVFPVTLSCGSHVLIPDLSPPNLLEAIEQHRITHTLLVPSTINALLNCPAIDRHDVSSLTNIAYGAAPMPEAVVLRALELLPNCRFTQVYGQTECGPLVSTLPPEFHVLKGPNAGRLGSAGHAVLGVEVKVVDEDDKECPRGGLGEICARGANVMMGYWKQEDLTNEALRGGWMHSGDVGYMDEEGFIYVVDRMKDMIISAGENVYSVEVENAIYLHPDIHECAVIGIPDAELGEAIYAIVRLKEGCSADEAEIAAHCRSQLAEFKCPRSIIIRDETLPLSSAGKVLKSELRKCFLANPTQ